MKKIAIKFFSILIIFFSICIFISAQSEKIAIVLNVNGAISPASSEYIQRGIDLAVKQDAEFVVLHLDTPGGLDKSMRHIIKAILASPIPIVTYIGPRGARAASAGTFILYASHIAAMAPGTNLGAASPVSIGGGMPTPQQPDQTQEDGQEDEKKETPTMQTTLSKKATNDAIAYIRSLAQLRGRNVEFAEAAVQDAATLTASEAKQENVIDLVASNIDELLEKLNGYDVTVQDKNIQLNTENIRVEIIDPNWRIKLLAVITDPSVAYILLLIGIYGLFFEFANPGFVLPGVVGAIAILLALYALQTLPISYAGLGLILLGIAFMVAEVFMPSFGALGIGGVVAFIVGSILLMDTQIPAYQIAWPLIIAMALANMIFFFIVLNLAARARKRTIVSGQEELLDKIGETLEDISDTGQARIHGEIWTIQTTTPLKRGQAIRVIAVNGIILKVTPVKNS
ncbi:MAG: nodulation protein NfeD [Gammaproteobacteria bacterium]